MELAEMFAAGAAAGAAEAGLSDADAESVRAGILKEAARAGGIPPEYGGDEEDTWWDRNKSWLLPALVGTGAFWLGADAGENGPPGETFFPSKLGKLWGGRLLRLIGHPSTQEEANVGGA